MNNIEIFQTFYQAEQRSLLDSSFTPLDNTTNNQSEYREYPLHLRCRDLALAKNLDLWGSFSWRWREKFPGMQGRDVWTIIDRNPGYDLYLFNPEPLLAAACINVWEQGLHWHPHLLHIMNTVYPMMGIDSRELRKLQHPDTMFFAQYSVGNKQYWNGVLELVQLYIEIIPKLPPEIKSLHDSGSNYFRDPSLWHFPFILERLLSNWVSWHYQDLKVYTYHHLPNLDRYQFNHNRYFIYDKLRFLKMQTIKHQDYVILNEWLDFRKFWPIRDGQSWHIEL